MPDRCRHLTFNNCTRKLHKTKTKRTHTHTHIDRYRDTIIHRALTHTLSCSGTHKQSQLIRQAIFDALTQLYLAPNLLNKTHLTFFLVFSLEKTVYFFLYLLGIFVLHLLWNCFVIKNSNDFFPSFFFWVECNKLCNFLTLFLQIFYGFVFFFRGLIISVCLYICCVYIMIVCYMHIL